MRTRNNQIKFYLSDEELKIFKKRVAKSKISQSDFIRIILLDKPIIVFENTKDFLQQLNKIGNNLNQLTRAVHQGKLFINDELEFLSMEVDKLWQLLKLLKAEKH